MPIDDFKAELGPALTKALEDRGFTQLTPIQEAVLDERTRDHDLRLSSQTGSGKTVAIGIMLRELAARRSDRPSRRADKADKVERKTKAEPIALVLTPTRELAKQVDSELGWLYAPLGVRIASVTGGSSYGHEQRMLSAGPAFVVGTPGRMLDHLNRGTIDPSALGAIVLDEADRMLELGFREDLDAIFAKLPPGVRTHLVSATFPREIERLANRVQKAPLHLEGTRLGEANEDIEHVLHVVHAHERFSALVNLLLALTTDARALVFAKTRAEVGELGDQLTEAGFRVATLSGEMEQRERNRALAAFKSESVSVLVATDVAARGIDVSAVDRVVHYSAPTEADAYTHRSGRTGRAGRRGTSHVLVAPRELVRVRRVLETAGVTFRLEPVPTQDEAEAIVRERIYATLTADAEPITDERVLHLARRLATEGSADGDGDILARLLAHSDLARAPAPREVTTVAPRPADSRRERRPERGDRGDREPRRGDRGADGDRSWVSFKVTWGSTHGADPRRLLAMVCRRGGIGSKEVGAIRIGPLWSIVDVDAKVASTFATAAGQPDPRDKRVTIRPDRGPPPREQRPPPRGADRHRGPPKRAGDKPQRKGFR